MTSVANALEQHRAAHLEELKELLRIPSISSLSEHTQDVRRCAEWLAAALERAGLEHVRVLPTEGHPVVYADWLHAGGERPTVLIYGHYDVQPVDPLELWHSPPFEPEVRDGRLYARGAVDDKGQLFVHIKAVEALLRETRSLPVNVRFLVEGEEEVGSAHLEDFIERNRDLLAADVAVISDTSLFAPDVPSITYGLRGLVYLQVDVRGPSSDLHSGSYGGSVANPAEALARIIAGLKDERGRVTVPGFYDRVRDLEEHEREQWRSLPFDEAAYTRELGVEELYGEEGYSTLERLWARPTLEVNGIWGGFIGEGSKTVLPAEAHAKISSRLVPNQDPDEIARLLAEHIERTAPRGVRVEVRRMHGGRPAVVPPDHPAMEAASRAVERGFGKSPVLIREGGSIPVVASFEVLLGAPTLLVGFGLPEGNAHAPNEWLLLDHFYAGIRTSVALLEELGRVELVTAGAGPKG